MAKKKIAVVACSLSIDDPLTVDAIAFMNCLNQSGIYDATLVTLTISAWRKCRKST